MKRVLTDARTAAPALLGCRLVRSDDRGRRVGLIVETEAYLPEDPACHAFKGRTKRNASMFAVAGTAYVYRIHRSFCLNVVTGPEGSGQAVLVRAIEPLEGVDLMRECRKRLSVARNPLPSRALTNGPGRLCQALEIDCGFDGSSLLAAGTKRGGLYLLPRSRNVEFRSSPRIGISRARDLPLRFFIPDNPWVSRS